MKSEDANADANDLSPALMDESERRMQVLSTEI